MSLMWSDGFFQMQVQWEVVVWGSGVRGQARVQGPGPSAPQIPVPPAAAAGRFPGPPACDGAERAPSDAAPPAAQREERKKKQNKQTACLPRTSTLASCFLCIHSRFSKKTSAFGYMLVLLWLSGPAS